MVTYFNVKNRVYCYDVNYGDPFIKYNDDQNYAIFNYLTQSGKDNNSCPEHMKLAARAYGYLPNYGYCPEARGCHIKESIKRLILFLKCQCFLNRNIDCDEFQKHIEGMYINKPCMDYWIVSPYALPPEYHGLLLNE